jgi:hypothetical protein
VGSRHGSTLQLIRPGAFLARARLVPQGTTISATLPLSLVKRKTWGQPFGGLFTMK